MMTSSNGNIFRITGHLCGEFSPMVKLAAISQTTVSNLFRYNDFIMGAMASQITSLIFVYSTVYSGVDQGKLHRSASLAFVRRIHRPMTRKMFPFEDVIMFMNEKCCILIRISLKFVPRGLIDNKPALFRAMAWHQAGDKPLPKPMLTNIYI